ncbi:kinase-like domain-containing protein [Trichoderma novae-zelandiae]
MNSGKCFAAKVPHFKASDAPGKARDRWESLSKEFQKLTTLKHAHIVEAIEVLVGKDDTEPPWLIMELMPQDLHSVFLEEDEIPLLLSQVNSALVFMHSNGFAHRDLKPQNILIQHNREGFVAKVADVGISKYSIDGRMQTFAGSIAYMAPEIWDSGSHYTNAVDMWSLGIIAVELWNPWNSSSSSLVRDMQLHRSWFQNFVKPHIDLAPPVFRPLLRGLLSESPGERWMAIQCEQWLQTYVDIGTSVHMAGEENRHVRSSHPTLSPIRANSVHMAGENNRHVGSSHSTLATQNCNGVDSE